MDKKYIIVILIIVCIISTVGSAVFSSQLCSQRNIIAGLDSTVCSLNYKVDSLQTTCDSIQVVNENMLQDMQNAYATYVYNTDSLNEEIDVLRVKLERIRYYNQVAAKGNNITFLRGWINRVLNE